MAFSTRVAPAVLKAIRNPVICANVARKARRGKLSKDIFLPFNIDSYNLRMTFWLYQWNTRRFQRMHGYGRRWWLLVTCSIFDYKRVPSWHIYILSFRQNQGRFSVWAESSSSFVWSRKLLEREGRVPCVDELIETYSILGLLLLLTITFWKG